MPSSGPPLPRRLPAASQRLHQGHHGQLPVDLQLQQRTLGRQRSGLRGHHLGVAHLARTIAVEQLLRRASLVDGEQAQFEDLFSGFDIFGNAFVLNLLITLKVIAWSLLFVIPGISILFVIPGMPASSAMPALSAVPFIPGISSAPSAPVVGSFSICIPVIAGSGMFMAGSGSETFHGSVPATDRSFRRPVPGFLFSVSCPALPTFRSFPFSPMPPPFAGSLIFAESFCFPVPLFCTGMCRVARPKA